MARIFNGVDDTLISDTAPATAAPLSISAWFKPDDVTADYEIAGIVRAGLNTTHQFRLVSGGAQADDPLRFGVANAAGTSYADVTGVVSGVWQHALGVAASATSRYAYLNGVASAESTTSRIPVSVDRVCVGVTADGTPNGFFAGALGVVAVWSAALTAAEAKRLARGLDPRFVRPQSLVAYWPLYGRHDPENDLVGSNTLTVTGTTVSLANPKIILPPAVYRSRSRGRHKIGA